MSMPSDVEPDISEATERASLPPRPPAGANVSSEQRGWLVVALVAFLGVAYVGPALTRFRRRPTLKERMARRVQEARRDTRKTSAKARKRMRRLGGGTLWR